MLADQSNTGPKLYADLRARDPRGGSLTPILEQHEGVVGTPEVPVDPGFSVLTKPGGQPPPRRGWRFGLPARAEARFRAAERLRQSSSRLDRWEYCWGLSKSTRFLRVFRGVHSASQAECREFDPPRPLSGSILGRRCHTHRGDDTGGSSLTNPADSASSGDAGGDGEIGAEGLTTTGNDLGGRSRVQVVVQGGVGEGFRLRISPCTAASSARPIS